MVQTMTNIDILNEYMAGNLSDNIELYRSCESADLQNQYHKIYEDCIKENFQIVYPEMISAVEAETIEWYCLYYDEAGNLCDIIIHKRDYTLDLYTDNEDVNEVYDWIMDSFKQNS